MQWSYEWITGWRYLRGRRGSGRNGFISFISMFSILGIALGVAALIIVLSVMNGFQKEVRDRMLSVVAHIEILSLDGQAMDALPDVMERIRRSADVLGAAPFVASQSLLVRGDAIRGAMVRGVDPLQEGQVSDFAKTPQGTQALNTLQPGNFGVVLGYALASSLGAQVGDRVMIVTPQGKMSPAGMVPRVKQMTVSGLFESGHFEYDSSLALMHVQDAALLFQSGGANGIRVRLSDLHIAPKVAAQIARTLPSSLIVRDWTQQNKTWFAAVQVEKTMMFIILTLIVAVAAFNLVSTLVMTVTDKRADIAILRTLGSSPKSIMGIFMIQGAMAGVLGVMTGLLLGLLVAVNIDIIVPAIEAALHMSFLPRDIYFISRMPSDPQGADIVPVVLIALLLAFLATLYPSWRASCVQPAEALRYE